MLSPAIKSRNYRGLFLLVALAFGGFLQVDAQCTQAELPIALFEVQALAADEIPTANAANHVGLGLVEEAFADIRRHKYNEWTLMLPFLGGKTLPIELESFLPFSDAFMIGRSQAAGKFTEEVYRPKLLTYRVVSPRIKGTIVVMDDFVMGTIQYRGRQYDLSAIRNGMEGKHVLFLLADAADPMEFECGVDEYGPRREVIPMGMQPPSTSSQITDCVEVAFDIDYYTFGTFGNDCYPAIEWALAILAGVNTIYTESVDALVNIQASYIHVWETTDAYNGIINDASSMLDTLRLEWLNNSNLSGIQRDIVHLLSRRTDTGTGGIAYLDVVCFPSYSAGFSANLESGNTYNLNNYAWNLNVVGHELGHNFGSNHTHWCGWSNGPIDNCYDVEGSCTNNPQAQVGTMMSYCHAVAGGSVNLEFHPTVVAEAFVPTITSDGSCFTTCVEMTTSCQYFGCTDSAACNYDPNAVEDDGTCAYEIDGCGVCGGDESTCSGCTDSAACNYDPDATIEDGGCFYPPAGSTCDCEYTAGFTVNLAAGETAEQTLEASGYVTGLDVTLNFIDTPIDNSWANEMMVGLTAPDGTCLQYGGYNLTLGCPSAGLWPADWNTSNAGTYTATAVFAEPISGVGEWTITILNSWASSDGASYDTDITFIGLCEGLPATLGCMDSTACNYNPDATVDDGSCEFTSCAGCTDDGACNYDVTATLDDGSCEYASCGCPGDLDGDSQVSVTDVLLFLSDFGCMDAPCVGDANGDGINNVDDLLLMLAHFGDVCE
ncbi:MAG: zinc-dependent metalloprotease family protein [Bacteroidota bacterium]|nr:zinc-dependent metalloprotease family protein [Bacteroidota bacterium]